MGVEDFSYLSRLAPGTMLSLGGKIDEMLWPAHSPTFDINEDAVPISAALLAELACRFLKSAG